MVLLLGESGSATVEYVAQKERSGEKAKLPSEHQNHLINQSTSSLCAAGSSGQLCGSYSTVGENTVNEMKLHRSTPDSADLLYRVQ